MTAIVATLFFTIRQTLLNRKIWLTILILLSPTVLHLVIRQFAPPIDQPRALFEAYHVTVSIFFVSVLVPLACMVHGTSLIGSDVEAGTMVYLTTRRMRKATVMIVKFIATALVVLLLSGLALVAVHFCIVWGRDIPGRVAGTSFAFWSPDHDLRSYLRVLPFAVIGYLSIFNLIGLMTKKPIGASMWYLVLLELVMGNSPVAARTFTLSYYLQRTIAGTMPHVTDLYELPRALAERLFPSDASGVPQVLVITAVAIVVAAVLTTTRQLTPTRTAKE